VSLYRPSTVTTPGQALYELSHDFVKVSSKPWLSYGLAGKLYISNSGWGLLSVPNALVHGAFDALEEPGVELPRQDSGTFNAHISVFRKDEIDKIGGSGKIRERGHTFRYTLGPVKCVKPYGWDEMSKVWMIEVHSPELQNLRKSYGLSALPKDNRFKFHITIGVRRKNAFK